MRNRINRTGCRRLAFVVWAGLAIEILAAAVSSAAPAACTAETEAIKRLEAQLAQHVRAVQNLGMPTTAQTAEQWLDITEQDREGARRSFFDGVQDASFALVDGAVQEFGSLNPWNVNPVI